jgi:hypothetical protein
VTIAASALDNLERKGNRAAARIGPTVCEFDGPIPTEKGPKTLTAMGGTN